MAKGWRKNPPLYNNDAKIFRKWQDLTITIMTACRMVCENI